MYLGCKQTPCGLHIKIVNPTTYLNNLADMDTIKARWAVTHVGQQARVIPLSW